MVYFARFAHILKRNVKTSIVCEKKTNTVHIQGVPKMAHYDSTAVYGIFCETHKK